MEKGEEECWLAEKKPTNSLLFSVFCFDGSPISMTFCALLLILLARLHLRASCTQATFLHLHLHTVTSAKIEIIPKFIISGKHFPKGEN